MTAFVRHWLLALQFFTRIPVTGRLAAWAGYSPEMLRACAAHLPGVGALVGGLCAAAHAGVVQLLPAQAASAAVAAVLCTALGVALTGALHEDGLADLADGLGGSSDRARVLEIMKDSRLGSFGVLALALALMAKVALLTLLAQAGGTRMVALALVGAHVTSRLAPLLLMHGMPYAGDAGQSKSAPLTRQLGSGALARGGAWVVAVLALLCLAAPPALWAAALLGATLALGWLRWRLQRRLQGYTGDGLGASQQLTELAFYLGAAVALGQGLA